MLTAYYALTGATAILWAPIVVRFYQNWIKRNNPISLAICAAIILIVWLSVTGVWAITRSVEIEVITFISTGISLLVALYANLAFYMAKKRFANQPARKEAS